MTPELTTQTRRGRTIMFSLAAVFGLMLAALFAPSALVLTILGALLLMVGNSPLRKRGKP